MYASYMSHEPTGLERPRQWNCIKQEWTKNNLRSDDRDDYKLKDITYWKVHNTQIVCFINSTQIFRMGSCTRQDWRGLKTRITIII